jgi:hypothetical protein
MLKNGTYAAWFKTSHGQGTGIVHVANGKISGGDSVINYAGHYEVDGDRFTATVTTRRHTAGHPTVFGIDEIELALVGTANGTIATCSGAAKEAPGMVFEGTLILSQETAPAPERPATEFDIRKLPKVPRASRGRWSLSPCSRARRPSNHLTVKPPFRAAFVFRSDG